jgi:hypothetical protein
VQAELHGAVLQVYDTVPPPPVTVNGFPEVHHNGTGNPGIGHVDAAAIILVTTTSQLASFKKVIVCAFVVNVDRKSAAIKSIFFIFYGFNNLFSKFIIGH